MYRFGYPASIMIGRGIRAFAVVVNECPLKHGHDHERETAGQKDESFRSLDCRVAIEL